MRAPRLASLELRRFGRGRLPRAAMAAMMLLPLLYGALYLWSFWDPYARLDRIPVALVDEDRGAEAGGERVEAGASLVESLHESDTFDWRETDAADAREGVAEGRYFLSLTVPEDFSTRLASGAGDRPATGALRVRTDDSNNYLVGQIARTVFSEVRAAASSKASRRFYDRIFVSFSTLHDRTQKAADGASDLDGGIGRAGKGAGELSDGLDEAERGSGRLEDGTRRLHTGSGKLKSGAAKVADGTGKLAAKVHRLSDTAGPLLDRHSDDIAKTARKVSRAAGTLRKNLDDLPGAARRAETDSRRAADALTRADTALCGGTAAPGGSSAPDGPLPGPTAQGSAPPEVPGAGGQSGPPAPDAAAGGCPQLKKAVAAAERAADVAADTHDLLQDHESLDELGDHLEDLERAAGKLAREAPGMDEDLDRAVRKVDRLNSGARKVADGAARLHTGLGGAEDGAERLDGGLERLGDGADALDGGLFRLADGSERLAAGLHKGAARIPDYDDEERANRSEVMADPVRLASSRLHGVPDYGTGFAPYFIPLSLWVGAMVAYMLLQPLNRRALAAGAPGRRIALAGWLPVAAIGTVQAAALLAVLHWGLGLQMARGAGTAAFLVLVTLCFTAIVQFLGARFGPAGRILVLALLMLQLTSAGGTYPVQTSPDFFNVLHPLLPMSYVVEGLRHLITGGGLEPVWRACAVLVTFTVAALALTAWTARRGQMWTMKQLHPELTL
ncbi:YhgE/Pip domain-containing protein [Streptomyces sp. RKND-216]|uniref:YhgE/Pip family protein n=1 Tax=Streptomyces sp. RKND-216 TaxID=2562581 RepID=UPI00109E166E|nr:YhgE/Pip domain-containing protein [Streptomyces sp. RKND-216]THA26859.1 YhgE/Pip domain-containing protein [Streptomyces sp. RKND-216]